MRLSCTNFCLKQKLCTSLSSHFTSLRIKYYRTSSLMLKLIQSLSLPKKTCKQITLQWNQMRLSQYTLEDINTHEQLIQQDREKGESTRYDQYGRPPSGSSQLSPSSSSFLVLEASSRSCGPVLVKGRLLRSSRISIKFWETWHNQLEVFVFDFAGNGALPSSWKIDIKRNT